MKPEKQKIYAFSYLFFLIAAIGMVSLGLYWTYESIFLKFNILELFGGLLMLFFTYLLTAALIRSH